MTNEAGERTWQLAKLQDGHWHLLYDLGWDGDEPLDIFDLVHGVVPDDPEEAQKIRDYLNNQERELAEMRAKAALAWEKLEQFRAVDAGNVGLVQEAYDILQALKNQAGEGS